VYSSPSGVYLLLDPASYPTGQLVIVFEIVNYGVKPSSVYGFCLLSRSSKRQGIECMHKNLIVHELDIANIE